MVKTIGAAAGAKKAGAPGTKKPPASSVAMKMPMPGPGGGANAGSQMGGFKKGGPVKKMDSKKKGKR